MPTGQAGPRVLANCRWTARRRRSRTPSRMRLVQTSDRSRSRPKRWRCCSRSPLSDPVRVRFTVNGQPVEVERHPLARLLDVLRVDLRLTGTKEGCGEGECGACSVMMNGRLVNSCLVPLLQADGGIVRTIEGL